MKTKVILVAVVFALLAGTPAFAQSQIDIGINVPGWIGVSIDGQNVTEQIPFRVPLPDLMYNYYWNLGGVKLGVGARLWTLIIISGGYPIVSAEIETDRLLVNGHIGGLVFGYFSPFENGSGIRTGDVLFPEVSALFRFTDNFAAGVSVLGVLVPELTDGFGYVINVLGRFRID